MDGIWGPMTSSMSSGLISEHGTHAQLVAEGGLYAELYHIQEALKGGHRA
jgi:hypothetical protein